MTSKNNTNKITRLDCIPLAAANVIKLSYCLNCIYILRFLYLSDNFIIQEYRWSYLGKEVGDDYTAFFLEIENFSLSPKISILNSLFMDLYTKQRNIVNFYNDKVIQSASMTNTNPVFSFNF